MARISSEQAGEVQRKIYDFIVAYMRAEGMAPTNREIGQAMKIPSTGHVDYHLSMLEKKHYIVREPKKSRGIKLVQKVSGGIPIAGSISAGLPIKTYIDVDEIQLLDVGPNMVGQDTYALEVKGSSMIEDYICDGDYVMIKPQLSCQNGDVVVAVHFLEENKSSTTLKRFFLEKNQVRLQPANSTMDPMYVSKQEWDTEWQVQGKVVAILREHPPFLEHEMISEPLDTPKASNNTKNAPITMSENEQTDNENATLQNAEIFIRDIGASQDKQVINIKYAAEMQSEKKAIAYSRITHFNDARSQELDVIQRMCRDQSERWSRYSLYAAIIGFGVILIGVVLAIVTVNVSLGFLTALASIMPNVAAVLFFQQSKEANKRLDNLFAQLVNKVERSQAIEYALEINDENENRYSGSIIESLLQQKDS